MKPLIRLASINAAWVLLLTMNSRIVNAHFSTNLAIIGGSQVAVSFGYFSLVKAIQKAEIFAEKIAYCVGGAVGAIAGVLLTWWVR